LWFYHLRCKSRILLLWIMCVFFWFPKLSFFSSCLTVFSVVFHMLTKQSFRCSKVACKLEHPRQAQSTRKMIFGISSKVLLKECFGFNGTMAM
jgi:hypothetical protein